MKYNLLVAQRDTRKQQYVEEGKKKVRGSVCHHVQKEIDKALMKKAHRPNLVKTR